MQALLPFDRFDLDHQPHSVRDAGQTEIHAPLAALDRGLEVATADVALDALVLVAVEMDGPQRDWFLHTQQRQGPGDAPDLVAFKGESLALESGIREGGDVKEVLAAQVFVEAFRAAVDRGGVDVNIGLSFLGCLVEIDSAADRVESPPGGGCAVVHDLEGHEAMVGFDIVGDVLGVGRECVGGQAQQSDGKHFQHGGPRNGVSVRSSILNGS